MLSYSVLWVSLDNQSLVSSKRSLLTLSTKQQNTNMLWVGTSSVGANWGSAPTLQAPTVVNLRLSIAADSVFLIALDRQLLLSKDEGEQAVGKHQSVVSVAHFTEGAYFAVLKTGDSQDRATFLVGR